MPATRTWAPNSPSRRCATAPGLDAALLLARAHTIRSRHEDAHAVLAAAELLAQAEVSGDYVEQRVFALYWGLRDVESARAFIAQARQWADGSAWAHRLEPLSDLLADRPRDFATTARVTGEAASDPNVDERTRRGNEARHALALLFTGDGSLAFETIRRLRPAVPFGYHETLAAGTWNLISIETGENIEEADAYVTGLLRDAVRVDDHEAAAIAAFGLATTEFLRGRYRSSARWFDESELHYEHGDTFTAMTVVLAFRVGIAAATGGDVEAALERMRARFGPAGAWRHQVPYVQRAEGWAARASGAEHAAEHFLRVAEENDQIPIFAAQLLYEAFRAGADVRERMLALAPRGDARLVRAYGRHVAARDGAELLAVAERVRRDRRPALRVGGRGRRRRRLPARR